MHALSIIALVLAGAAFLRSRRHAWACAGARGRHHHHHHHRHHRGWRRGGRGRGAMYELFARLDLTPAQERELRRELEGFRDKLGGLREEGARSRADLAAVLRADSFDDAALEPMFARHDERLAVLRVDLAALVALVHQELDERQRQRLADLLESGRGPWRGPYR